MQRAWTEVMKKSSCMIYLKLYTRQIFHTTSQSIFLLSHLEEANIKYLIQYEFRAWQVVSRWSYSAAYA